MLLESRIQVELGAIDWEALLQARLRSARSPVSTSSLDAFLLDLRVLA
jgi:hypothetical protein